MVYDDMFINTFWEEQVVGNETGAVWERPQSIGVLLCALFSFTLLFLLSASQAESARYCPLPDECENSVNEDWCGFLCPGCAAETCASGSNPCAPGATCDDVYCALTKSLSSPYVNKHACNNCAFEVLCNGLDDDCDGTADEGTNPDACADYCVASGDSYILPWYGTTSGNCCGDDAAEQLYQKYRSSDLVTASLDGDVYACCTSTTQCANEGRCYDRAYQPVGFPHWMCGAAGGENAWLECKASNLCAVREGKTCVQYGGIWQWTSDPAKINSRETDWGGIGWTAKTVDAAQSTACCSLTQCVDVESAACYNQGILAAAKGWVCSDHKAGFPAWYRCDATNDGRKLNENDGYCCSKQSGTYEFHATPASETVCGDSSDNDCDGMTDEEDPDCPITLVISPASAEHYSSIIASIQTPASVFDDNTNGEFYLCRGTCTITGTCSSAWNTLGQTSSSSATLTFYDREWGTANPATYSYSLCYGENSDTATFTLTKTCDFGAKIPSICNERDVASFGSTLAATVSTCSGGGCAAGFVPPMTKRKLWTSLWGCGAGYVCPQGYYETSVGNVCCPLGTSFTNQTPAPSAVYGCYSGGTNPITVSAPSGVRPSVACNADSGDSLNVCPTLPEATITSVGGTTASQSWLCRNGYYPNSDGVCCPVSASYNTITKKCYMSPSCNTYCESGPSPPAVPCIVPGKCGGTWSCVTNGWVCGGGSNYNCDANCDGTADSCANPCPRTCGASEDCSNSIDDDEDAWVDEADDDCAIFLNANSPVPTNGVITFSTAAADTPLYSGAAGSVGRNICLGGAGCRTTGLNNGTCSGGATVVTSAISGTVTAPATAGVYAYHVCIGNNSATRTVTVTWPPEICALGSGDEDHVNGCDYDSQTCAHGDTACCVRPSVISAASGTAYVDTNVAITCSAVDGAGSGVGDINSMRVYRDANNDGAYRTADGDVECVWNATTDRWVGNAITFNDCPVGGILGVAVFRCGIQSAAAPPDRSWRCAGTDPAVSITVTERPPGACDLDGDGYNGTYSGCSSQLDCNDNPATGGGAIHPPASYESGIAMCADGKDNDCDGAYDYEGLLKDGIGKDASCTIRVFDADGPVVACAGSTFVANCTYDAGNVITSQRATVTRNGAFVRQCSFVSWSGTVARFDCDAGMVPGDYNITCSIDAAVGTKSGTDKDSPFAVVGLMEPCEIGFCGGGPDVGTCIDCNQDSDPFNRTDKPATCWTDAVHFDCQDLDPSIYYGAPDICMNGVAENCVSDGPCLTRWDGRLIDATTNEPITAPDGSYRDGVVIVDGVSYVALDASFTINNLPVGTHTVLADAEGYDPVSGVFDITGTPIHRQNITLSSAVCSASCSIDGYCAYECIGQNGCAWSPDVRSEDIAMVQAICENTKSDIYRRFNNTHYVRCCAGGFVPVEALRVPFSIQTTFRQVFPHTRTILGVDGKFYQLVSLAVGGKD